MSGTELGWIYVLAIMSPFILGPLFAFRFAKKNPDYIWPTASTKLPRAPLPGNQSTGESRGNSKLSAGGGDRLCR